MNIVAAAVGDTRWSNTWTQSLMSLEGVKLADEPGSRSGLGLDAHAGIVEGLAHRDTRFWLVGVTEPELVDAIAACTRRPAVIVAASPLGSLADLDRLAQLERRGVHIFPGHDLRSGAAAWMRTHLHRVGSLQHVSARRVDTEPATATHDAGTALMTELLDLFQFIAGRGRHPLEVAAAAHLRRHGQEVETGLIAFTKFWWDRIDEPASLSISSYRAARPEFHLEFLGEKGTMSLGAFGSSPNLSLTASFRPRESSAEAAARRSDSPITEQASARRMVLSAALAALDSPPIDWLPTLREERAVMSLLESIRAAAARPLPPTLPAP